ncbi:MAG: hypothetical protein IKZ44_01690, partial [Clostridia bacterium]|nr:hypothetical protein [Clostridia bacterium]
ETYFNVDGSLDFRIEYEYDANGNRIRALRYDSEDKLEHRNEYEYDANGNKIRYTRYYATGTILEQSEYAYDENGNKISEMYSSIFEDTENERIEYEWAFFENAPKTGKYNAY